VRFGWKGCLLLLDIDHFKKINDESGHQAGDSALRALGHAIGQVIRVHDLAIRWGGDEFVLLLPSITPEGAEHALTRLRNDAKLSISAGVAEIPEDGSSLSGLIKVADRRLYLAKRAGRNTTQVTDET
jgi:diguanylate cyclase (GGDEF)-like protein